MKTKPNKMPKFYYGMWGVFTLAYLIWMCFFMNHIVLEGYESISQRTVDGLLYNDITGMMGNHWLYPVWVVISVVCMLLFPIYIKSFMFSDKTGKAQKLFCLSNLILGFVFITWYGFFKDPHSYTASMIGLDYPWHFRMWGVFASLSIFTNTLYMYNKYNYYNPFGIACSSVGSAAIFITINVPSFGEELSLDSLRCMSHWIGALGFAFLCAAPIIFLLFNKTIHKDKRFAVMFFAFAGILLTMIILLVTVGKDGLIESLPMWAAYIVLFLANFTGIFTKNKAEEKELVTK